MVTKILDQFGNPIDMGAIEEPQTSHLGWLQHEMATHPSRGLTPSRLAQILLEAEQNNPVAQYDLFDDMEEKDAHIGSEMGKRRLAVAGLTWTIEPPRNASVAEKKATEQLREIVSEIDSLDEMMFDITDAIGKAFANLEIEWHFDGDYWLPKTITHRPQSWFRFYRGYRQEIRLRDASAYGAPLNPFGWIMHVHKAKSGYLERAALFRMLVWPYLFKNYSVGDLAEFLEIYGIPIRLGKYPSGASPAEKSTLLRALVNIGHNAAGIIPDSMLVEFEKAAEGDGKGFIDMIDWCERSQSKAILGATLTSQADRGSNTNALGNIHNEVRKDLRDSDAKKIAATLTRDLLYPIAALNGLAPNGINRMPHMMIDTRETKDLKTYADALPALVNIGVPIPARWATEQLRIPAPEAGEDLLKPTSVPVASPLPPGGSQPTAVATASVPALDRAPSPVADPTPIDPQAEVMAQAAVPIWTQVLDRIRALVEQAADLPSLRDALLASYADLPADELAEVMAMGMAAAELAGRFDARQDSGA
jgi:phage gp29-like protein